jgi:hypothetical protein
MRKTLSAGGYAHGVDFAPFLQTRSRHVRAHQRRFRPVSAALGAVICLLGIAATPQATGDDAIGTSTAETPGAGNLADVKSSATGSRITLRLDKPVKAGSRYLWVQTAGPPIDLSDRTGPELKLTVPPGADALGFLLVVADDQGIRTSSVDVPIAPVANRAVTGASLGQGAQPATKADAGDDQIGLVGRRITLNGSGSQPRAGLTYRWIQFGGPEVKSPVEAGSYFSFVPGTAGVYRFALVVASQNRIAEPDYVTVTVGSPPGSGLSPGLTAASLAPISSAGEIDTAVSAALLYLDDAAVLTGPLSSAFETSSSRMDLYQSYGEVYSELSRRLDAIMPQDPLRRARWNTALFEPLTQQLIARMLTLGLDLRSPAGQSARLSDPQKQELKSQFDRAAKILRSVQSPR